jgi:superfamily II DNA or RNA helicase
MEILQLVNARGRRWRVADVRAYEACELVTLIPATAATEGSTRRLLTPFDEVVPVEALEKPRRVGRRRWRRACRALIASDAPPGSLLTAASARFDLFAYQLQPSMAVLHGLGTRVLLADEVGLGKTVQASLVFAELLARGRASRVLILAPAGLRDQWAAELAERFAIEAPVADASGLRQLARTLPLDVNPWDTTPIAIASIDYVKRPEVLPAVAACRWDVLVVDEAHAAVGDSERHQAVHLLGSRASYVLLLTATPHSGDPHAFQSLRDVGATGPDDRLLVFRRTRRDVHGSLIRRTHFFHVKASRAERRMIQALARYHDAVRVEHPTRLLALSVLDKRAFSSAWSLAASVDRRLRDLGTTASADVGRQLRLPFDPDGEMSADDEPPEWPEDLGLSDVETEKALLGDIAQAAQAATACESKTRVLARLLRRVKESVLVFTEYRDTAFNLSRRLGGVPILHGGLDRQARRSVVEAFTRAAHPVLIATDAGGQGLNLHLRCRLVVNLELPWNPTRLEQRVGRVDRLGQTRRVHAIHLVGRDTGESAVLSRLQQKAATASASIADADSCTDFGREARAELARLSVARQMVVPGDAAALAALDGCRWWTLRARPRTRGRLGRCGILIYRARVMNAAGGITSSHLIGLAASPALVETASDHPALVDRVTAWLDAVAGVERRFWRTRIAREERIVASAEMQHEAPFQPGLFDRRTDRLRSVERSSGAAFLDLACARLVEARRQSTIRNHAVDLMLVLHP